MRLNELFKECLSEHWDSQRFRLSGHFLEVKAKFKNHINPVFGEMEYLEITRAIVRDWHKSMIETPVTANRCLEILSKLYRFSIDKEWNQKGFNPCFGIKHFTEKKRKRYASEKEIQRIGEILDRESINYPVEMGFLLTLLYTGARPRSIERAKWSELQDLENGFGILTFDGKSTAETGDEESVIMPPNIMDLMRKLPKRSDGLIFGIPLPGYKWRKIRKEAGALDLWARDFRRSFATIGMGTGIKMDTIGKLLNHHSTQTTSRYALLNQSASLEAISIISNKLNQILKK